MISNANSSAYFFYMQEERQAAKKTKKTAETLQNLLRLNGSKEKIGVAQLTAHLVFLKENAHWKARIGKL